MFEFMVFFITFKMWILDKRYNMTSTLVLRKAAILKYQLRFDVLVYPNFVLLLCQCEMIMGLIDHYGNRLEPLVDSVNHNHRTINIKVAC